MGYTHYWYRQMEVSRNEMKSIGSDFNKIILALNDMGVRLGDGLGENVPVVTEDEIYFNGLVNCGHKRDAKIVVPWPTPDAGGVNRGEPVAGSWFAGVQLQTRTCDGDCSYETFAFPRALDPKGFLQESEDHKGLYFSFCKTAFRPYDVAVTAFLIIAKHHLGKRIRVSSDGEDQHWNDAKMLCDVHLGYGFEYKMTEDGLAKVKKVA